MPEQPIDPRLVEQTRQHIRTLVAEINQLAGSDIPPQQFYGEFLQRVVLAVAGVGGALWTREGPQPPRLQHQVNFQMSGLLDEASLSAGHGALLMHSFSNGSAKLVPPRTGAAGEAEREGGSNSSDWSLLLAPLHVD
ncbi:MAG: secretion protein HlyD, partial [Planctomycetes bacterium]|nr:secretion protein HlyD [Planctomycetota bacterium]